MTWKEAELGASLFLIQTCREHGQTCRLGLMALALSPFSDALCLRIRHSATPSSEDRVRRPRTCTDLTPVQTFTSPKILFLKILFVYLFLSVLGLCGCEQAFSQLLQVGATLWLWRSGFSLGSTGLVALRHMGAFWTRGWTGVPYVGRGVPYHWATGEALCVLRESLVSSREQGGWGASLPVDFSGGLQGRIPQRNACYLENTPYFFNFWCHYLPCVWNTW